MTETSNRQRLRVGIIGAGRVGTALGAGLRRAQLQVDGPVGRGELPTDCDAIVLCVPDAEIPAAAAQAAGAARLIGHTSGATPLDALAAAGSPAFGLHPLQTVPDGSGAEVFEGAGCAVAGSTPEALQVARALAGALGMIPFEIDDEGRAAYHAAATMVSNFVVTLHDAAERVAVAAGLEAEIGRALLAPLARRAVENVADLGPQLALTGPIARGDEATIEAQRRAVGAAAPELLDLFDQLVHHTRLLAAQEVRV